jgi:uracil-DNA glycosylase
MSDSLERLEAEVTRCRMCPRLVSWREQVAVERRAAFREEIYWGRPVPGFGDPGAKLLLLGLAPAAHGGNRTGRVFTGDRSGDFLFAAMWRTGLCNVPRSDSRDDGLLLEGAWVTAAVRCAPPANRPTREELGNCLPWTGRELSLLGDVRAILCLGSFAWDAALKLLAPPRPLAGAAKPPASARPGAGAAKLPASEPPVAGAGRQRKRPRFAHGEVAEVAGMRLIGCYHPSQQNTFTGRLTEQMLDEVLVQARQLAGLGRPPRGRGEPAR